MPYVKPRGAWRPTGLSLYTMTRTDLTLSFGRIGCGRSSLGVTSCRTTTRNLLYTNFCTDCKAIPRLFGVVRLRIHPESTTLHPITGVIQGRVFDYIPGVNMAKLKPGVDLSEQEAKSWRRSVVSRLRTASCTMTFTSGMSFCGMGAVLQSSSTLDPTSGSLTSATKSG